MLHAILYKMWRKKSQKNVGGRVRDELGPRTTNNNSIYQAGKGLLVAKGLVSSLEPMYVLFKDTPGETNVRIGILES